MTEAEYQQMLIEEERKKKKKLTKLEIQTLGKNFNVLYSEDL